MASVLETCCGSPAYAAPELVTGMSYLGSEADIWSMGVLLYALLCGFLPFDDENISALYRKIQQGKYELPSWLSAGSIRLLDSMLQTEPKRRITVDQLLAHPWLMDGYDRPVKWQSRYHVDELDEDVVAEMAAYKVTSPAKIAEQLKKWDYSSKLVVTYFLLLNRKQRGLQLGLTPIKASTSPTQQAGKKRHDTPKRNLLQEINQNEAGGSNSLGNSPRGLHSSLEGGLEDIELLSIGSPQQQQQAASSGRENHTPKDAFDRTKNRASERYPIPNKKRMENQQPQQQDDKENSAPLRKGVLGVANSPLSPSRSMDSGQHRARAGQDEEHVDAQKAQTELVRWTRPRHWQGSLQRLDHVAPQPRYGAQRTGQGARGQGHPVPAEGLHPPW
jgi:maternal embryonic leucine zipper kinase